MNKKDISILFVEDDINIRKNYVDGLKLLFKNIYETGDGEEALSIYHNKKPEILIIDINIEKLNGIKVIKKIREYDQNTKIIILTAYSNIDYLLEASELKLIKYLLKPIKRDILINTISLAIEELNTVEIRNKKILLLKDGYIWNFNTKSLEKDDIEIPLTRKEKEILNIIFTNPFLELTYNMIIESVWDNFDKSYEYNLKTMMKNIRKKLPKDIIKTIYGIGYKLNNI